MYDLQVLAWQTESRACHVPGGARTEQRRLSEEHGPRCVPHPVAPLEHPGEQGSLHRPEPLSRRLLAYFLDKLQKTPDGDGTLLDHSLVLYGSGLGDGNQHDPRDLPVLVAGGGSGSTRAASTSARPKDTPMANLLVRVLAR
jgi:hypothetical protein